MNTKITNLDGKIKGNERTIIKISEGKTSFTTITTKGSKDEIKYKLEVEN